MMLNAIHHVADRLTAAVVGAPTSAAHPPSTNAAAHAANASALGTGRGVDAGCRDQKDEKERAFQNRVAHDLFLGLERYGGTPGPRHPLSRHHSKDVPPGNLA